MDFDQKCAALAALGELSIKFREAEWRIGHKEPWYVSQQIDIKRGPVSCGEFGNGMSPQDAIEDHWCRLTELKDGEYLVVRSGDNVRRVRWNGFMWSDVRVAERTEAGGATAA